MILRIMGIDFGDARVGLAISDPTQTLAGGIGFVSVSGVNSAVKAVCEKITETGAETAVCGLPLNMNGTEGERAQKVRAFAKLLEEKSGIPVIMVDERRTTIMAHGFMNETGTHGKKRKLAVDTLSARGHNTSDRSRYAKQISVTDGREKRIMEFCTSAEILDFCLKKQYRVLRRKSKAV